MKKLVIFIFIVTTQVFAQSWPGAMYTTENLFTRQFSGLRSYIKNLKINYPYTLRGNKLIFYTDNGEFLEENFKLIVKSYEKENYIKETIVFDALNGVKETFVYERWGKNLRPLSVKQLTAFEFSIPQGVDAFRIEFQESKVFQYVEYLENSSKSHYRLYGYGLEIHHYEEKQRDRLYSKLWYQCDVCSGEPIVAIMDTRARHLGNMSYFYGSPLKLVTPKEFFNKANRSYLSGIYREFQELPLMGISMFGWPRD